MEIRELLEDQRWKKAIPQLEEMIQDKPTQEDVFNLIICYIKVGESTRAFATLNKYGNLLEPSEKESLEKEILEIPTKVKQGEVKAIAWFKSDIKLIDVIGLKKVKQKIVEEIINPIKYEDRYKEKGIPAGGGFVFFGPPGTGKTMLAKAIAGETDRRMLIANIHEMVSKYQGESSKNLHKLFEQAREGGPAIIFIDEMDSIAQSRNSSNVSSTGGEDRRIIDSLLVELDGAQKSNKGIYVIGATNHPWDIDSGIMRSGRFNTFVYIPPPSTKERAQIFKYYLAKLTTDKIDYNKLALLTFGMTPSDINTICINGAKHAMGMIVKDKIKDRPFITRDFIWAIAQMPRAPLLKEFNQSLEKIRTIPAPETEQYKELKKDIRYFHANGKQREILYKFFAMFV